MFGDRSPLEVLGTAPWTLTEFAAERARPLPARFRPARARPAD
ncbi:MAG: hypothetical protein ACR2NR_10615 [Solirubrobacteraceae bacterium]